MIEWIASWGSNEVSGVAATVSSAVAAAKAVYDTRSGAQIRVYDAGTRVCGETLRLHYSTGRLMWFSDTSSNG